ncbi:hypothetical protein [Streptosporangium sp. H16]|uniref:hypothetical protein n=1 Tax=Streptosporangium sp. H16 TaxID=3444184 RepID=UPI003F7AA3A7
MFTVSRRSVPAAMVAGLPSIALAACGGGTTKDSAGSAAPAAPASSAPAKAGKLGERTIGKDGEIVLGPPFTFDASDIDQFDF